MAEAIITTTSTDPKHIGIVVEMDIPVKLEYSSSPETIQITIMSNLPNRLSQLQIGDEVDLEGTSTEFGIITEIQKGGIITIKVATEWAALHKLGVGIKMELMGF